MPTTYAHYQFGEAVRKKVSPQARKIIDSDPELFHFGVHGPDLLFYYDALGKNPVNTLGGRIHDLPGEDFFRKAAKVLARTQGQEKRDAACSYLYGFLCHFTLDVFCHGYIQQKMDESGITHAEIEAELDRELLAADGKDPVRQCLTAHLKPSEKSAETISAFFEGVDERQIFKAMKDMVKYLNLLVLPSRIKRGAVFAVLKLAKQYESKHGLVINYEKNQDCADSTAELIRRLHRAVPVAAQLIDTFMEIAEGNAQMQEIYQYNFSSVLPRTGEVYGAAGKDHIHEIQDDEE